MATQTTPVHAGGLLAPPTTRRVLAALAGTVVLGGLTALGQTWLPAGLAPLANSSGSWTVVAFLCALLPGTRRGAALTAAAALLGLLAGYVVTDELRGYPSGSGLLLFWGAASLTVGPLVGLGAHWLRHRRDVLAGLGAGGLAGVLVGEAGYGLTAVSESTPAGYWWGSAAVGAGLVVWASAVRLRGAARAVAPLVAALVAAAFVLLYARGGALMGFL